MSNDQDYFSRRAAAEWQAVAAATCDAARIAHASLAIRYVELARKPSNVIYLDRFARRAPTVRAQSAEG
ncbi:MAG TPA: hypothetical protein VM265_08580 [Sphingomicrobium sp.]|nr:hypothetical protein [Sphingomicrobium sp.]